MTNHKSWQAIDQNVFLKFLVHIWKQYEYLVMMLSNVQKTSLIKKVNSIFI
jgi:hypothetical protein